MMATKNIDRTNLFNNILKLLDTGRSIDLDQIPDRSDEADE
jgi:hypothetical protein